MATKIENAVLETMIEGVITEIMVKTSAPNVVMDTDTGKTLSAAVAEIIASIATKATPADIDNRINALVGGAPAAFDTLKEIADYLATHKNEYTALVTLVGTKVDKVSGKGLSTNDFTTALKTKLEGLSNYTHPATHPASMIVEDTTHKFMTQAEKDKLANIQGYTHPNSGVTAGTYSSVTTNAQGHITAGSNPTQTIAKGGTGATTAAGARANLGVGRVLAGETTPADLAAGDLFFKIVK